MAGDARQPLRLDRRDASSEQPRRLDQLGRHDPAPGLLRQVRARVAVKADATRAEVGVVVLVLAADVAQQAGEHRQVDLLVGRRAGVEPPAVLGHHGVQLRMDVAPLAHAARRDEVLAQQRLLLAHAQLVFAVAAAAVLEPLPELQVADELGLLVVELAMRSVGRGLLLDGPVAHVLHAEGAGDDQHLGQRLAAARLEDHAAHARVQRQLRQLAADGGQLVGLVDGAELGQQLVAVGDGAPRRRLEEGEVLDRAQAQRLHAQDHAGERRAQDLRIGEARPAGKVLLVVQPDADAVGDAPAAAGALVGRGLADGLNQQLLDLVAVAVALDARRAGIDHVADARHRQRGLGDVRRQHDAARAVRLEDAVLLGLAQSREQRQHLDARRVVLAQVLGRLADLALAGQEDEHVAAAFAPELVDGVADGVVEAVFAALLERPPALFHRVQPARHLDHRRRPLARREVLREALGVDGGRGDDDLQVGAARQDLAQVPEQEVDVQAAFVGLVDDQRVVGAQQRVGLGLGEQDAVGHQLDRRAALQPVLETDLEAHDLAERRLQLLGDALGHAARRDAPRLGVADQAAPAGAQAAPQAEHDLRQLRGLARARLAADDDDLVRIDRARDLLAPRRHRQRLGEMDRRDGGGDVQGHGARIIRAAPDQAAGGA